MKIEKLTENKIRIIVKQDDLKDKNLFVYVLDRAKAEFGFDTDGHKLLIESFSVDDDFFIFTITKLLENSKDLSTKHFHKPTVVLKNLMCAFDSFDDFCSFCSFIKNNTLKIEKCFLNSKVYTHNNFYYLVVDNKNLSAKNLLILKHSLNEFGKVIKYSKAFEAKLIEYGKPIFKDNAIYNCINYFC